MVALTQDRRISWNDQYVCFNHLQRHKMGRIQNRGVAVFKYDIVFLPDHYREPSALLYSMSLCCGLYFPPVFLFLFPATVCLCANS